MYVLFLSSDKASQLLSAQEQGHCGGTSQTMDDGNRVKAQGLCRSTTRTPGRTSQVSSLVSPGMACGDARSAAGQGGCRSGFSAPPETLRLAWHVLARQTPSRRITVLNGGKGKEKVRFQLRGKKKS